MGGWVHHITDSSPSLQLRKRNGSWKGLRDREKPRFAGVTVGAAAVELGRRSLQPLQDHARPSSTLLVFLILAT